MLATTFSALLSLLSPRSLYQLTRSLTRHSVTEDCAKPTPRRESSCKRINMRRAFCPSVVPADPNTKASICGQSMKVPELAVWSPSPPYEAVIVAGPAWDGVKVTEHVPLASSQHTVLSNDPHYRSRSSPFLWG